MNNKTEDQILTELLRDANEQPPKALDDLILNQAKVNNNAAANAKIQKRDWKPWLAAASVALVMPLLWMITNNEELTHTKEVLSTPQITPKPSTELDQSLTRPESTFSDADFVGHEQEQLHDMGEITITGSRIKQTIDEAQEEPATYIEIFDESIETESQRSITGKVIDQESLETNKVLLKNELKAKKRTIKPSNMNPLMALEYEQFGRYLEQGQFDLADQLLTEMQDNWPDFDFEDMIYRLAEAETKSD